MTLLDMTMSATAVREGELLTTRGRSRTALARLVDAWTVGVEAM